MRAKCNTGCVLEKFIRAYGAPKQLIFDGANEQCGKDIIKYDVSYHITIQIKILQSLSLGS